MTCPHCHKEVHIQDYNKNTYQVNDGNFFGNDTKAYSFDIGFCPSCRNVIVLYRYGDGIIFDGELEVMVTPEESEIIYPKSISKQLAKEIPEEYKKDFLESYSVNQLSPKASAALSRRLLQQVFHEELNIQKRNLNLEIDEFISNAGASSVLNDSIDAIRTVGNFAAHPLKSSNSGEIVDVEPGEAEWLLEVLEDLFDFVFVQPEKLKQRREALNKKLQEHGKPDLKGQD